jgi:hypothetical protein
MKPVKEQPLFLWFERQGHKDDIKQYFLEVEKVLGIYRSFFNALKHSSNQIMILQFIKPDNDGKIIGFYLEGVDNKGVIGPIADLHPKHESVYTAWSYNFHLSNFYFLIYQIAIEIEKTIERLIKRYDISLLPLTTPLVSTNMETLAADAFSKAKRLMLPFNLYYPQEYNQRTKSVSLAPDNSALVFSDYIVPADRIILQGSKLVMSSRGDGFSRSWRLLYL